MPFPAIHRRTEGEKEIGHKDIKTKDFNMAHQSCPCLNGVSQKVLKLLTRNDFQCFFSMT